MHQHKSEWQIRPTEIRFDRNTIICIIQMNDHVNKKCCSGSLTGRSIGIGDDYTKWQYLLTLQVSRYCLLALQSRIIHCCLVVSTDIWFHGFRKNMRCCTFTGHTYIIYVQQRDVVPTNLQYSDSVVKMVVFHGWGAVDGRQWRRALHHELVSVASMIHVMAEARHKQAQALEPAGSHKHNR